MKERYGPNNETRLAASRRDAHGAVQLHGIGNNVSDEFSNYGPVSGQVRLEAVSKLS